MRSMLMFVAVLFSASCAISEMPDYQKARVRYEEKRFEAARLNDQLSGLGVNDVEKVLGRPAEIKKTPYPYLADSNCTGSECKKYWADEIWFYEFSYRDKLGRHIYSVNVYFKNGSVAQIY